MKLDDIYQLVIPTEKLAFTNDFWNNMKLNNPWLVGTVTAIIQQKEFTTKEEWRDYYFETGAKRLELLEEVPDDDRARLTSMEIWRFNTCQNKAFQKLNFDYGRTLDELKIIGDIMYGAVRLTKNPHRITRKDCHYMVQYRLLGETWNGLIKRERNTIKTMETTLGEAYTIKKVDGQTDIRYEVDAEVYHAGKLLAGIQIKPESYKWKFANNKKFYEINKRKNDAYTELKGVPVIYIYSDTKGTIKNSEALKEISALTTQKELVK